MTNTPFSNNGPESEGSWPPQDHQHPDGNPFTSIEDKQLNDKLFSEMTTRLRRVGGHPRNTTPIFLALEACFRILDSPVGTAALSIAFAGLSTANKLQKIYRMGPEIDDKAIATPLSYDAKTSPTTLAAHIQQARHLYNQAPSHPIPDQGQLRGKTMAAGLLRDAQQIAVHSEDVLSFEEALSTAVAQRDVGKHGVEWSHALDIAQVIAYDHFNQVGMETMVQQPPIKI